MNAELLKFLQNYKVQHIKVFNNKKNNINDIVDQIYVINLSQDIRKRNYITILLKKYNINYNLIIVENIDKNIYSKLCNKNHISESELGCCMSHMWCLIHILKNNLKNAIIFEDDIILSKNFINDFIEIHNSNSNIDFLMLGAHDFNFSKSHSENVTNKLYRPNKDFKKLYGAHANYYSYNGAKRMFYIRATNLSFFDNEYNLLFDTIPNSFICYPNLVLANISESRINHKKEILSKDELNYYKDCFSYINLQDYNFIYTNLLDINLYKKDDNIDIFIERCLMYYLNDYHKVDLVKKRITLDFFSIDDLKQILNNYSLITPNNLSKKCIGENS